MPSSLPARGMPDRIRRARRNVSDYQVIARLAYENGVDLYEEAGVLLKRGSPRAFTLAVASIEELMKSFLCDTVFKQDLDPDTLVAELDGKRWRILKSHKSKHILFALFLMLNQAKKEGQDVEETRRLLETTLTTDSLRFKGKAEIERLILSMETRRQDSLYVDTKSEGGKVKTPKNQVTTEMSQDLISKIEEFLPTLETNLKVSRGGYMRELSKMRAEREAPG
jgi:AbiV family abortive infection protein